MITVILGESGAGKTTFLQKELNNCNKKDVAYLPQEISGIFNPLKNMQSQIFEVNFDVYKYKSLLDKLNLKHLDLKRYPYEFSKGELQRFGLLIIFLKQNTKKIFLDEPTSSLDLENQNILLEILKMQNVPMLITTHNLNFAKALTTDIKIIANGKLKNFNKKYVKNDDFIDILDRNYKKTDKNLSFLHKSKIILIFGKSGYGKTNFLQEYYDFLIKNDEKSIFLSQNYGFSLPPHRKIIKTLLEAINFKEKKLFSNKADIKEIIKIFKKIKLSTKFLKKYPDELSLGERQRILIIRAILLKVKNILLDEPTSSLDLENEKNILNFLLDVKKEYSINFIIVSHSSYVINSLLGKANNVIFFKKQFEYDVYKNIT